MRALRKPRQAPGAHSQAATLKTARHNTQRAVKPKWASGGICTPLIWARALLFQGADGANGGGPPQVRGGSRGGSGGGSGGRPRGSQRTSVLTELAM